MIEPGNHALTNAQRERDAAIRRVRRVRRATVLGAGALTAALAGVVSAVAPGRSLGAHVKASASAAQPAASPRGSSTARLRMPPLAGAAQLGLGASGEAPQSNQSAPPQQTPSPQPAPQPAPAPAPAPQTAPSSAGGVVSGGS